MKPMVKNNGGNLSSGIWTIYLTVAILVLVCALYIGVPYFGLWSTYEATQMILHPFDYTKDVIKHKDYVIVFDGGSTGTRIHIFSFVINHELKQRKVVLENENYFYTKPGLSSFAHNVSGAVTSLEPLLHQAFKHVPTLWASQTPLILKATAGLRLLPTETANEILRLVYGRLRMLPYKVEKNAVSMLDEKDEGLFAWYTVNFLLDKLHNITESIATLDLGGGSTQVTFSTNDMNTLVTSPPGYITKQNIEGEPEYIYTHSYLGNGLMSARQAILLADVNLLPVSGDDDLDRWIQRSSHHLSSPCFKPLSNGSYSWSFNEVTYHLKYDESKVIDAFTECYERAVRFMKKSQIDKPQELPRRQIYAMGYFYDRMKDIRVVKHEFGFVKVRDYFIYAEHVCHNAIKLRKQSAFLCLDLTYIAAYLHHGLGLPKDKDLMLVKKINGFETSWALGAAINMFDFR